MDLGNAIAPMNPRELSRFEFRMGLFRRRGCTPDEVDQLADRCLVRDRDRDTRHFCLECAHLQQDRGCFAARQGWFGRGVPRRMEPVRNELARCDFFEWSKP